MNPSPQQKAAIDHRHGHALVQAVAGSGKTGTLVARVLGLIAESPDTVVRCVMFNRDAADEFKGRIEPDLPPRARVKVQTFHSLGYALTRHLVAEGWLEPATVETDTRWIDTTAQSALRAAKTRFYGGRQSQLDHTEISDFVQFYDRALGDIGAYDEVRTASDPEYFPAAAAAVERERLQQGMRGFAHLLSDPIHCLREQPGALAAVSNRIDQLLVDEFQDVNAVQYELIRLLAGERAQVMVCGDPDQTIYAWRGARIEFITARFQHDFHPVATYPITYTQRYGHEIALLASHAVRHNRQRPDCLCVSAEGTPHSRARRIDAAPGSAREALTAAVEAATDDDWGGVGVLCRLWSLAIPYRLECLRRNIPYHIDGNRPALFSDLTLRAVEAVLRVAAGRFPALSRVDRQRVAHAVLSMPSTGLKEDALERISARVADHPTQAESAILEGTRYTTSRTHLEAITARAQLWGALESGRWRGASAAAVLDHYARMTELIAPNPDRSGTDQETATQRLQMWLALVDMARASETDAGEMADLIDELRAKEQARTDRATEGALCLTTVHSAKGLQWDVVVLPGLSEGVFPCRQQGEPDMEAERRLFYVALTRARRTALLITPPDPKLDEYGNNRRRRIPEAPRASRFVYEASPGWEVARVARGETDRLIARDPDCARQYLEAIGFQVAASD